MAVHKTHPAPGSVRPLARSSSASAKGPSTSVGAAHAKAHLLSLIEEVKEHGTPVIITKRGKPQVKVAPLDPVEDPIDIIGCMKGTFTITGDVVGPEPDDWEAMQ